MGLKNNKTCEWSSRFDAALQKAREERDVKRRGTFRRANKNRYILSTDVSLMARWWLGRETTQLCPLLLPYTSTWSDMLFPYRPPRPQEVSSKKPVPRFREVVPVKKHGEIRDPRFDERAGSFNESLFKKSYAFLGDMKKSEKQVVQKEARRARNPEKRVQLKILIQQMVSDS